MPADRRVKIQIEHVIPAKDKQILIRLKEAVFDPAGGAEGRRLNVIKQLCPIASAFTVGDDLLRFEAEREMGFANRQCARHAERSVQDPDIQELHQRLGARFR